MSNNIQMMWEKWSDPFGYNPENNEWSDYDDVEDSEYSSEIYQPKKINAIITSLGIIPYNEYTDCSKIFNFWTGHTNFNITENICNIIQDTDGVETLDVFTRYRFRVSFGKAFIDRDIMNNINTNINNYFNHKND
jgi:hypothetical protein